MDIRGRGGARFVVELFGSDPNGRKMIAWGRRTRGPSGARQAAPPDGPVSPLRGSPKATTARSMLDVGRALAIRRAKRATTVAAPARSGGASEGRVAMELVDNPVGLRAIHPAE